MFAFDRLPMAKSRTRNNGEVSSETQAAPQPETQAAPQTGQALEDWLAAEREMRPPDAERRGE
jgi:hypothetical protein